MTTKQKPQASNWPLTAIGRQRIRLLKDRINAARVRRWELRVAPDPPVIAKARKLVAQYDKKRDAHADVVWRASDTAADNAECAVLFAHSADEALHIVERFEALSVARGWKRA